MVSHEKDFDRLHVCTKANDSREERLQSARFWLLDILYKTEIERDAEDYYINVDNPTQARLEYRR